MQGVEPHEVVILIPYIGGEFVVEMLGPGSNAPGNLPTDSESATDHSLPALRSELAVSEKRLTATFQWKVCLMLCYRLFAVAARLVVR